MTPQTKLPARTRTLLVRHVVYLPYIFRSLYVHASADNNIIVTPGADNRNVPIIGNLRYVGVFKLHFKYHFTLTILHTKKESFSAATCTVFMNSFKIQSAE